MTYQETIDYLFTRLPMFSRVGASAIKKDLHNTVALCESLGNPHHQFKTIHIAGTNGKGSVSHMLAAILQTAGYKTGLYTSPHLYDFRERIRVNGEMVNEEFVIEFTHKIQSQIKEIEPSFFEITVAMAFAYFAEQQVDIAVIETGLGGRLDSTNVITPVLSVITNIGWDHMNLLGDTLGKIATEKAGIIKEGIPVVIGEISDESLPVFTETAQKKNASLHIAPLEFSIEQYSSVANFMHVSIKEASTLKRWQYNLDLNGLYQTKNILTVVTAIRQLQIQGWNIKEEDLQTALSQVMILTGLSGRWEILRKNPFLVLDVAHNVNGIVEMLHQLEESEFQHLHLVIGMVKDKDISGVLQLLPTSATYYFSQAHIPRAMPAIDLKQKAAAYGLQGAVYENVNDAVSAALKKAASLDFILVCGSVFLVSEVQKEAFTNFTLLNHS